MYLKRDVDELNSLDNILSYAGKIFLGTPFQEYLVSYDTGSCQFWIEQYNNSFSSSFTKSTLPAPSIIQADGTKVDGYLFNDVATISNITISNLTVESTTRFRPDVNHVQGILGLCHKPNGSPSFLDEAINKRLINERTFTLSVSRKTKSAEFILGYIDKSRMAGQTTWIPILPNSTYWETILTLITNSKKTLSIKRPKRVIFDTGTSMIIMPSALTQEINSKYGFSKVNGSELYQGSCEAYNSDNLIMSFGTISLTLNSKSLIYRDGVTCYSVIMENPLDDTAVVIGSTVFRNFYTTFNGRNHTIGFSVPNEESPLLNPEVEKNPKGTSYEFLALGFGLAVAVLAIIGGCILYRRYKRSAPLQTQTQVPLDLEKSTQQIKIEPTIPSYDVIAKQDEPPVIKNRAYYVD